MRTNFKTPTKMDAEFIKRQGFHDQGIVVVSVNDHRLTWDQREILKQIAAKLYGAPPQHSGAR